MTEDFRHRLAAENGQAMAEYGLIMALIAVVCIVALTTFGAAVSGMFQPLTDFFGS